MRIRSFTVGAAMPQDEAGRASLIDLLGTFAQAGRVTLEKAGFTVQTTRLSTQPLDQWLSIYDAVESVANLDTQFTTHGIDYCSLGTIQAAHDEGDTTTQLAALIPDLLAAAGNCFASLQVGTRDQNGGVINLEAVRESARIIQALSRNTPDGFGNLRFAAASNCPPHIPFFPASYYAESDHNNGGPEFGLALEAANLAVTAFTGAENNEQARQNLLALLIEQGTKAAEVCGAISAEHGFTFTGLDISMAPYPSPDRSIGRALEMLSGAPLGSPGTLASAAYFTSILKEVARVLPTVGYSGLMLPALEDQTLADRAAEGTVTIDTLLLLSAVCGLGLDTVPLPGDVTLTQLERIILDMAALAVKLDKPLTARLMPVPGQKAGDPAEWPDFPYFAKGKVMHVGDIAEGSRFFEGKQLVF